eukprot:TRINITY_DN9584_c0_g2_i2.p1 TRINITY_DN9584_c0_g2~~TRINITY_DN9584_c0_g2_i2.p1  ORF type:complete len:246 (-),score=24.02 TRINITY_DN9584_c0_g2_i2:307-1044(-)
MTTRSSTIGMICGYKRRKTFVEVYEKKPEPRRRKSAPVSLERCARQSRSLKVGSLLSTFHQAQCSTDLGCSAYTAAACGNNVNTYEEEEVTLNNGTFKHETSTGEAQVTDLPLSPDTTQVPPDPAQGEQFLTFMVCDLPCKVGEKRMMSQLKTMGFNGCYDYLYFPKRKRNSQYGEGYCFINFMSAEVALRFKTSFHGHRFSGSNSLKQARVEVADIQGLQANLRLFTNRTEHPKYIIDVNGIRL